MHILVIPSEEFLPPHNQLDGIFQYHQAVILKEAGHRVGVLSVKLGFSVPMVFKGLFFKLTGKKSGNATDDYGAVALVKLGLKKFFRPRRFVSREAIDGLTVYRVDGLYFRRPAQHQNHLSWVKAGLLCFGEYLKREGKPDVIHAHNAVYAGMLAQKIHDAYGLPYVITEHSSLYALKEADAATLHRAKKAFDGAAALAAVSEAFAGLLNKQFSFRRFRCLPNVLDQQLERHPYEPSAKKSGNFVFLHVASLIDVKDQATLLKAYKLVAEKAGNTELWIGGSGYLLEELTELARRLGIESSVKFLGRLNREEVIERIQSADCFVLSSKYETFGVVVIEAMLFGKPVVVTRVGVGQSIVTDKTGYVVDVGNADQLSAAMLKMALAHNEYDAAYIRRYAIAHFGKEAFLRQVQKMYDEVVPPSQAKHGFPEECLSSL